MAIQESTKQDKMLGPVGGKDLRGNDAKAGEFVAGPQIGMNAKSGAGAPNGPMNVDAASAGQGAFTPGHQFGAKSK